MPPPPPAPVHETGIFGGVEPLEVFVDLLSEIESDTTSSEFYHRICEAICRLTTMRRAAIFLYDASRMRVRAVGSHGISFTQLAKLRPTLHDAPIAQRALLEDRVIVVKSDAIDREVPRDYAQLLGITALVCTPLAAAGHRYGVIVADRGAGDFELGDGERHLMWTLGKTAALAATARNATRQQERTRRLGERIDLAREIHERVMQRLFGVSLVLSTQADLSPELRERCRTEMGEALADLRSALERPLAPMAYETGTTLRAELERHGRESNLPIVLAWDEGVVVPRRLEGLAQSVLGEALRNVRKHADPSRVAVAVQRDEDTFTLEVRNDGITGGVAAGLGGSGGMGLRLAAFEALQHNGFVEFGPEKAAQPPGWRVRLVVPVKETEEG
ncbi:GAF domain-containing protein [Conexibacter sp. JD483]|uniref:GAF domain-containing sensor histidine kinase n=1 Tax=unclassified Conexibacter TaxID=2627773 RepID=UPI002725C6B0|nr:MULTISPECIES: GAF domain-containing protein [unclassified Conexibacter]MDO8189489.1 GAF domain-containing protein [Conexibacter sp. CPCC 205706]MDO8202079.1 GAF domain-containing protein [Conexibacter sp. CPCC 205762]MDR9372678.1 GAF domain-containing protein [Conexibacter sp. JD483]